MIEVKSILVLFALVGISKADFCQDNFTMSEFPDGILRQTLSILFTGTVNNFNGCSNTSVSEDDVKFFLYTRQNLDKPIPLTADNLKDMKPNKPVIMIIHGWLCSVNSDRMPELKDAYLKRYDANVIGVDWSAISVDLYTTAYCKAQGVAEIVGKFMCNLNSVLNIDLSQLHVLGHSMGGQISGLAGQQVQKMCQKKIGRITGLDPAGPLYQGNPISQRLDKSDAMFVDVIHSNQGAAGYYGSCGDVDFYPNCGTFQLGCMQIGIDTVLKDIINIPLKEINCNHVRSLDYMIESINSNRFRAVSCEKCPGLPVLGPCIPDIFFSSHVDMGEKCPWNPKHSKYFLITNRKSPYGRG